MRMEGSALLFMLLSWGLILGLNLFCFTLLFTKSEAVSTPPAGSGTVSEDEEEEIT